MKATKSKQEWIDLFTEKSTSNEWLSECVEYILSRLIHYKQGGAYEVYDNKQLSNAMEAFAHIIWKWKGGLIIKEPNMRYTIGFPEGVTCDLVKKNPGYPVIVDNGTIFGFGVCVAIVANPAQAKLIIKLLNAHDAIKG